MLVSFVIVSCAGTFACTTKGPEKEPAPPESPSTSSQPQQEISSDNGSIWDKIPLSFRKNELESGNQSVPAQPGEWSNTEWRYFHTPEALPVMRQHFRNAMPQNGWDQEEWVDEGDSSLSLWVSNSGADRAMVWMVPDEPGTFVAVAIGNQ
jgi:hypothetical protein